MDAITEGLRLNLAPSGSDRSSVAIAHDYLVSRGGAERVVLAMKTAFPEADIFTALYEPSNTYPEFADQNIRTAHINRVGLLRRNFRFSLPFLAPSFTSMRSSAAVTLCSSSGWAHGITATGRKVVYCHTPAHWLYEREKYLGELRMREPDTSHGWRGFGQRTKSALRYQSAVLTMTSIEARLARWDVRAAKSADRYIANSQATADAIRKAYDIEAEVLHPPPVLDPDGPEAATEGLTAGFWLCVSRLMPYKNVATLVRAFHQLPDQRLVVVGDGPDRTAIERLVGSNVRLLGSISDERLRWLYRRCKGLVSAAHEDFGLTPLEAASFGRPSVVLRAKGFLDTVSDGTTGVMFDTPSVEDLLGVFERFEHLTFSEDRLRLHADQFSVNRFVGRLREVIDEESAQIAR